MNAAAMPVHRLCCDKAECVLAFEEIYDAAAGWDAVLRRGIGLALVRMQSGFFTLGLVILETSDTNTIFSRRKVCSQLIGLENFLARPDDPGNRKFISFFFNAIHRD